MKLAACKKCGAPIARQQWVGLTVVLDLPALDHQSLAEAWTTGRQVWKVRTFYREQIAQWYWPSITHIRRHIGQPITDTLLTAHQCPGALVCIDEVVATWQPRDAAAFLPVDLPKPVSERVPF